MNDRINILKITFLFLKTGKRIKLSLQEVEDCLVEYGYRAGSIGEVLSYIRDNGITRKSIYRNNWFRSRRCLKESRQPIDLGIQGIHRLTPGDEENLKRAVALVGPIAASIRVTESFIGYSSGIFLDGKCFYKKAPNHAVLVVGYGSDPDGTDFWVIRNSWGSNWGENGFMRLARNSGLNCGVSNSTFYPILN